MCDTLISRVYFTQSILHTEIQINDNERCLKNLNQCENFTPVWKISTSLKKVKPTKKFELQHIHALHNKYFKVK